MALKDLLLKDGLISRKDYDEWPTIDLKMIDPKVWEEFDAFLDEAQA